MEKNYSAPKECPEFQKYWNKFIIKVTERDNFHESHLEQLTILCDLYSEYHRLSEFIKENGYTYSSDGRYGQAFREYPEVKIQQKAIAEIRAYSKMLGLILNKDTSLKKAEEEEDWS